MNMQDQLDQLLDESRRDGSPMKTRRKSRKETQAQVTKRLAGQTDRGRDGGATGRRFKTVRSPDKRKKVFNEDLEEVG